MVKLVLVPTTLVNPKGQTVTTGPAGRILQGKSDRVLAKA